MIVIVASIHGFFENYARTEKDYYKNDDRDFDSLLVPWNYKRTINSSQNHLRQLEHFSKSMKGAGIYAGRVLKIYRIYSNEK